MAAMKCQGCGSVIDATAKFCPECGTAQRFDAISENEAEVATIPGLQVLSYSVPRHPEMPSPDKKDVLAGGIFAELGGKPWGWPAIAYRDASIPPAKGSLICSGAIIPFNSGLIFLSTNTLGMEAFVSFAAANILGLAFAHSLPVEE